MKSSDAQTPNPSSSAAPTARVACRQCRGAIDHGDAYCRYCGAAQVASDPFYYRPAFILIMAFLVLGPFALPLVWRARAMGRNIKLTLTAIIVAYSLITFYAAYEIGMAVYRHFRILGDVL